MMGDTHYHQHGQATVEAAVLYPALLLFLFIVVQVALVSTARSVASAAAEEGVRAGRAEGAPPGTSRAAARALLTERAGGFLSDAQVSTVGSTDQVVRVSVSGRSLTVIPGHYRVSAQAHGPVERLTGVRP